MEKNAQLSGGNLLTRWQRKLKEGSDIQLVAYYDRVNRLQSNQAEYRNTFDVDFVHHLSTAPAELHLGPGGRGRVRPSFPRSFPHMYLRRTSEPISSIRRMRRTIFRLFRTSFRLTAGAKLLHSSFTGFDVEPSVRLLWTPTPRQSLWAAVTRAVRTPSDIEDTLQNTSLVSTDPLVFSVTKGDGRFTSETLLGYEAGYRSVLSKSVSLDIAAFFNSYDHLQSLEPPELPLRKTLRGLRRCIYPYVNGNGVKGTTSGFEIAPDWKPASWWRLQGSYSLLHMDLRMCARKPGHHDGRLRRRIEPASPGTNPVVLRSVEEPGIQRDLAIRGRLALLRGQGIPDRGCAGLPGVRYRMSNSPSPGRIWCSLTTSNTVAIRGPWWESSAVS